MNVTNTICFPTIISVFEDFLSEEQNNLIYDEIMSSKVDGHGSRCWMSAENSPDNSFGTDFCLKNKVLEQLVERVKEEIVSYQNDIYQSSHKIKLKECWYNKYTGQQHQEMHHHLPSLLSCVYYVKVPDGSKGLTFFNPYVKRSYPGANASNDPLTSEILDVNVRERDLLVFPSHVPHMVQSGTNTEPRITLSFNFE